MFTDVCGFRFLHVHAHRANNPATSRTSSSHRAGPQEVLRQNMKRVGNLCGPQIHTLYYYY